VEVSGQYHAPVALPAEQICRSQYVCGAEEKNKALHLPGIEPKSSGCLVTLLTELTR